MQELYSENDVQNCKKTLKSRIIASVVVLVVCLAVALILMALRLRIACIAVGALGMCVSYFFWCMKGLPWLKYNVYLRDMQEGLSRETEADFVSIADTPRYQDGVLFHEMIVKVETSEPDEGGERLFLWDADKPIPQLKEGQRLRIQSFGNHITALGV